MKCSILAPVKESIDRIFEGSATMEDWSLLDESNTFPLLIDRLVHENVTPYKLKRKTLSPTLSLAGHEKSHNPVTLMALNYASNIVQETKTLNLKAIAAIIDFVDNYEENMNELTEYTIGPVDIFSKYRAIGTALLSVGCMEKRLK